MARAERNAVDPHAPARGPGVVPTVRYRDVPAAIDWLCEAFGFEEHRVVAGQSGGLQYAELTFGGGMVMVAPVEQSAIGKLMVQPREIGGVETQICYLFVGDARAHHARAKAAGADILLDIQDQANGGRGYSCRDPEGHIWNFGTYDPWQRQGGWSRPRGPRSRRGVRALSAVTLLAAVAAAAAHGPTRQSFGDVSAALLAMVAQAVDVARAEKGATERDAPASNERREALAKAQAARAAAERDAKEARAQLALERQAREAAERAAKELNDRRNAEALATRTTADARAQLEAARSATEAAERAAKEARELLGQARNAKKDTERTAKEARDQLRRDLQERRRRAAARADAAAEASPLFPDSVR
jgi:uncharacterized glyoxalase superfamily protein PhnB